MFAPCGCLVIPAQWPFVYSVCIILSKLPIKPTNRVIPEVSYCIDSGSRILMSSAKAYSVVVRKALRRLMTY